MTQEFVEILGLHLRSETFFPQTHRLLCQQSNVNSQVYEAFRKFIARHQPTSKMTSLQMLRSSNSPIQLPALVLQQGPDIISHENPQQDAKKSRYLDPRDFQNITFRRHRSHCQHYTY